MQECQIDSLRCTIIRFAMKGYSNFICSVPTERSEYTAAVGDIIHKFLGDNASIVGSTSTVSPSIR
jgi:hypothetical protein